MSRPSARKARTKAPARVREEIDEERAWPGLLRRGSNQAHQTAIAQENPPAPADGNQKVERQANCKDHSRQPRSERLHLRESQRQRQDQDQHRQTDLHQKSPKDGDLHKGNVDLPEVVQPIEVLCQELCPEHWRTGDVQIEKRGIQLPDACKEVQEPQLPAEQGPGGIQDEGASSIEGAMTAESDTYR